MSDDWYGKRAMERRAAEIEDAKATIKEKFGGNARAYVREGRKCETANRATRRMLDKLQGGRRIPTPGDFDNTLEAEEWMLAEHHAANDKAKREALKPPNPWLGPFGRVQTLSGDEIHAMLYTQGGTQASQQTHQPGSVVSMTLHHEPEDDGDRALSVQKAAIQGTMRVQWQSSGIFKMDLTP
jgi:hypothetical protein